MAFESERPREETAAEAEQTLAIKTSVLVVSYNCEQALRRCLRALQDPEKPASLEILVADNGSRDASSRIDDEFPNVTVLRLPRNFGRTKARNIAARTAKGEYFLLLEPDVEIHPGDVLGLGTWLEENPQLVAVCPLLVDAQGHSLTRAGDLPGPEQLYQAWREGQDWFTTLPRWEVPAGQSLATVACTSPGAILVRGAFLRGMNYFDERYGDWGAELELFTQIARARKQLAIVPACQARWGKGQGMWHPTTTEARALVAADYASGILRWTRKHYGAAASWKLRLKMILSTFGQLLALQEPGYRGALLARLLAGRRVDGTQLEL